MSHIPATATKRRVELSRIRQACDCHVLRAAGVGSGADDEDHVALDHGRPRHEDHHGTRSQTPNVDERGAVGAKGPIELAGRGETNDAKR